MTPIELTFDDSGRLVLSRRHPLYGAVVRAIVNDANEGILREQKADDLECTIRFQVWAARSGVYRR
jgi:hypothetical protein